MRQDCKHNLQSLFPILPKRRGINGLPFDYQCFDARYYTASEIQKDNLTIYLNFEPDGILLLSEWHTNILH